MKTGWKTTEFWVVVLTDVGIIAAALGGALPPKWAAVSTAISGAFYAVARGLAKNGSTG